MLVGTKYFRRLGYKRAIVISFILVAAACIPIALAKTLTVIYIAQFVAGFGRGICFTVLLSLVVSSVPGDKKVTATGLYQALYALGMFLGPIFTGLFSQDSSFIVPYSVMSGMCLVAAAFALRFTPKTA